MLLQLSINNFALIEKLQVSFDEGFNVLSGETGAGKSILIDAINFVLGGKFNKDLIRTGEDRTFVEAVFTIENEKTIVALNNLDIEDEGLVILSRETFQSGKTIAKVNGKTLLLSQIKQISETLLDIHGQHENQNLLDANTHLSYLDSFGNEELLVSLDKYSNSFIELNEIKNKLKDIEGLDGESEKLIDFYKYQFEEIETAKLVIGEDEELEKRYKIISNAEKINKVLEVSYSVLYEGYENSSAIIDEISHIIKNLRAIEKNIDDVINIANTMEEAYYNIDQIAHEIRSLRDGIAYDEIELNSINERINLINNLKKKYGNTIQNILEYKEKIKKHYEDYSNKAEIAEKLKAQYSLQNKRTLELSNVLSKIRLDLAKELAKNVKNELDYVGLEKSRFEIEVIHTDVLTQHGGDKVQFLISTNPGEPLKPLEKIVSGGELSRIMLALKTVFVHKDHTPTIIFDEIDVGISGRIAQSVGEKMFLISTAHQVFCITHLPQIACISDWHYMISKESDGDKTYTKIEKLDKEEKEYEIARMVGGSTVTNLTIAHSQELIALADDVKRSIRNTIKQ